jgi:hypothetical protein
MENQSAINKIKQYCLIDIRMEKIFLEMCKDWGDEGKIPLTILTGNFADILSKNWANISEKERKEVFLLTEKLMNSNEELVQTVVATGFLESLLHAASRGIIDYQELKKYFGEGSQKFCEAYIAFSDGNQ